LGIEEYPLPEFMSSKWLRSIRNPKSKIRNSSASPASLRENPHREFTRIIANFTGHWSPVTGLDWDWEVEVDWDWGSKNIPFLSS
jgi:hypothetical protein